jgi:hypothetical protein
MGVHVKCLAGSAWCMLCVYYLDVVVALDPYVAHTCMRREREKLAKGYECFFLLHARTPWPSS